MLPGQPDVLPAGCQEFLVGFLLDTVHVRLMALITLLRLTFCCPQWAVEIPSASHSFIYIQFLAQNFEHKNHAKICIEWKRLTLLHFFFDLRVYLALLLSENYAAKFFVEYFNNIYEIIVTGKNMSFS